MTEQELLAEEDKILAEMKKLVDKHHELVVKLYQVRGKLGLGYKKRKRNEEND